MERVRDLALSERGEFLRATEPSLPVAAPPARRTGHSARHVEFGYDSITNTPSIPTRHTPQIGAGVHYSASLARGGQLYVWGTLGLAHNDDDAAASAAASSPNTEAQQQSWDVAGLLQLEQAAAGASSVGLACGPYHLAVFGGGGRPQQA